MITLKNVIDTRTGKIHSIAVIKEKNARFFAAADNKVNADENA